MSVAAQSAEVGNRETMLLMGRAMRYLAPLKSRMAIKVLFVVMGSLPVVIVPFPGKIVIDNIILGRPLAETNDRYPFFFQPFVDALIGASVETMILAIIALSLVLVVFIGAWTRGRDTTRADLAQGMDAATRSENQANMAWSYLGGLLGWIDFRWTLRISHDLNHHYRSQLFERIQRLPMTALDNQRIGDAIYRLMYDTPGITDICFRLIVTPLVAPISMLMTLWVMSLTYGDQPVVMWTAAAVVPVALLLTVPFSNVLRRRMADSRKTGAVTTTTIEESISNILAVQSLGGQRRERERFEQDSWRSFHEFRRFVVTFVFVLALAITAVVLVGLFVFYEVTDRVFAGDLSVGDTSVIFIFYAQIAYSANRIGRLWIDLQGNAVAVKRAFELMDAPSDHQPEHPRPLDEIREGYRFEDVSFQYPDGTRALDHIDLEAERGQMLALVGPAGAGKTTLAYMFPRFVSPTSGRVLVDGVDLADIDRDSLRKQVAFVFQEPVLFDATVADNIRMGDPDASDERVRQAAELAGAAEFINRLPQGYDTPLGRSGGRLSVGQKQRLSIARALVREAPVLILDEPTAALDPVTEFRFLEALRKASQGRLVLVIAHRLSTIRRADRIVFLRDGRIVEQGSHEELMDRPDGAYRHFVELQGGR